jgi:malonate transporter MadL subunit|tara:strand:- start:707 stop:1066 length:360 start_codon:yes stop_codon:yes gene_type:complete
MVIYGIALLGICTLVGLFVGKLLGSLFGIDANVGGIGIAMFLLMYLSSSLNTFFKIGEITEKGITFWSLIYIPIVVAMAAKQNVLGAIDGGLMAIIAGIAAVFISFLFIPIISNFNKDK